MIRPWLATAMAAVACLGVGSALAAFVPLWWAAWTPFLGLAMMVCGPVLLGLSVRQARRDDEPRRAMQVAFGTAALFGLSFVVILWAGLAGGDLDILPAMMLGPVLVPLAFGFAGWGMRLRSRARGR